MKLVITGVSSSRHSFNSHVGMGSNSQDLVADFLTNAFTFCSVVGANSVYLHPYIQILYLHYQELIVF
jgi:hypothetical protein